jgi:rhamnogalacturonyl hydrolase YesR
MQDMHSSTIAIMKKIKLIGIGALILFLSFSFSSLCTTAQQLPEKKNVLAVLALANKYFMNKWPDTGKDIFVPLRNRTWPSHIWTRAVYYEGLMALYSIDKKKEYYDYAVDWSNKHNWSLRNGVTTRNGDNQVSLHDSTNFGGKELTGTSLFICGMAWGINNGHLDKKIYLPIVIKAWNAIVKESVHPSGFLGFVQGTGKEPKESQPVLYDKEPDFEDFGLGCFLLAGSEVYKLSK